MKLALPDNERVVRASCYLALVALPLMVWSIFDPRVWPVLVACSTGYPCQDRRSILRSMLTGNRGSVSRS